MDQRRKGGAMNEHQTRLLRKIWHAWKVVARKIGEFQARVILTLIYYTIIPPFALLVRWISDPLTLKPGAPKGWQGRTDSAETEAMRAARQY